MRVFHDLSTTNWTRVSVVVASATAFWLGLSTLVPEKYHHVGIVVLGAVQSAVTLLMRAGQSPQQEVKEAVQAVRDSETEKQASAAVEKILQDPPK
jgi:hypothetical protein